MPQKNFFATCLFSAVVAGSVSAGTAPLPLDVMPAPAEVTCPAGRLSFGEGLKFVNSGRPDRRLDGAIARAERRWRVRFAGTAAPAGTAVANLVVECAALGSPFPDGSEDESYTLEVNASGAVLKAATDLGALHGLETFLQLPKQDKDGWFLPPASIRDRPRFPWRGLMIDVARRWQPIDVIERNLDAMAAVKLNVLHLHLTDDQGFRIQSRSHPELEGKGSDRKYYSQDQMRALINFAADRGIRVVPEFDIPGHATSWVVSHPELASLPGPYGIERQWGVFNPVLDPTNEATYALLGDFLGEMCALFPDKFMHIGGDENNGVQWNANPSIQAFIRDHGLKDNEGLHAFFNRRVEAILKRGGKRLVGWDEIMNPDLPRDCVIDSWRGPDALGTAASDGFDGILSNGFYIDLNYPASEHYGADPSPASSTLTPAQRSHVLGGEATMWAEWVSPETIDSRIWPRTAAIAERLWSPADVRDVPEMYRRLAIVSQRLDEAGSLHLRNQAVMLRHLVGENLGAPGVSSLATVIGLLEPVKHYKRGGQQIWCNQLVPLVGLADAAHADSTPAREFADDTERLIFSEAGNRSLSDSLLSRLEQWSAAARDIPALAAVDPAVREALPASKGLIDAGAIASAALHSLSSGVPISPETLAANLAALDAASEPNESATKLPVLKPIRLLAAAAAKQGQRAGLSAEKWRALVVIAAYPGQPDAISNPDE